MLTFQSVLVPVDFSERSRWAFEMARALASNTRTRLVVLHVIDEVHVAEQAVLLDESGLLTELPAAAPAHLQAIEERLRELYPTSATVEVEYRLREGEPAEEAVRQAKGLGCDLIVVGSHGRTGLDRLLLGSVAEAVLRHAPCPVLVVKSPAGAAAPAPANTVAASIA
ncbi:MAG TPA: universal stress protein [Isosphaeraceae bacterium]|jgi:universal stress protein A|nr:universal stress protein [Isosphaeraceae bacterium]